MTQHDLALLCSATSLPFNTIVTSMDGGCECVVISGGGGDLLPSPETGCQ